MRAVLASPAPPPSPVEAAAEALRGALGSAGAALVPVRAQYVGAQALRFSFFLAQILYSSRVINNGVSLDPLAIARGLASVLAGPGQQQQDVLAALGLRSDDDEEAKQRLAFWQANFNDLLALLRREADLIDAGVYALPYDLLPTGAPEQWNPASVLRLAASYARDQQVVRDRRLGRKGQEMLENFVASEGRYPAYYLQNFHFQASPRCQF